MGDAEPKSNPRAQARSSPWMARLRKRGQKLLHSKYVVIVVILLTITDCALVIAELILDLYSVKKTLSASEKQTYTFVDKLSNRFEDHISATYSLDTIYNRLACSSIQWKYPCDMGADAAAVTNASTTIPVIPAPGNENNDAFQGQGNNGNSKPVPDHAPCRDKRSVKGSFNNDKSRIFGSGSDFKNLDYLVTNDSLQNMVRQLVRLYRKNHVFVSAPKGRSLTKTANYHVDDTDDDDGDNNDDDDDDDDNVDDFRETGEISGDKPSDIDDNNDTYYNALQQLSQYISMQIQSSIQDDRSNGHRSLDTTPFSVAISASASSSSSSSSSQDFPSSLLSPSSSSSSLLSFISSSLSSSSPSSSSSSMFPSKSDVPELYRSYHIRSPTSSITTSSQLTKLQPSSSSTTSTSSSSSSPSPPPPSLAAKPLKPPSQQPQRPPKPSNHLQNSPTGNSNIQIPEPSTKFNDVIDLYAVEPPPSRYTVQKNETTGQNQRLHQAEDANSSNSSAHSSRNSGISGNYEMEIAHKLHYASLGVVSILMVEVVLKIVCSGSHFLKRKIEVFDAGVIVTSVVVDLIFIKGLSEFPVDDSMFVLAFLLPWRVIRVVNSLVMAAIDHEHVKLRLLYSRKKKLDKTVEQLRNDVDELKGLLQDIRQFCIKEGIEASTMDELMGKFAPRRRKDSKFYTLVKLVMSTASINNDNVSISSSSMENELRDYAFRDSIINETTSNENTITSLKQYLSVPFKNSRMQSESPNNSDGDSNEGGPPMSPCIYVTSPNSDEERFSDGTGGGLCDNGNDGDVDDDLDDDDDDNNVEESVFSFDVDDKAEQHRGEREHLMKSSSSSTSAAGDSTIKPQSRWRHIRSVFNFDNENKRSSSALVGLAECKVHEYVDDSTCETSFIDMPDRPDCDRSPPGSVCGAEGGVSVPLTLVDSFCFGTNENELGPRQTSPHAYRGARFLSVPPVSTPRFHPMHNSSTSLSTTPSVIIASDSSTSKIPFPNNNNNNDINICLPNSVIHPLPPLKRSASANIHSSTTNSLNTRNNNNCNNNDNNNTNNDNDNDNGNNIPPENLDNVQRYRYDSPVPTKKSSSSPQRLSPSPGKSPQRLLSMRRNSATTERESKPPKGRSVSSRARHNSSGEPARYQSQSQHRRCQSERSRSSSPSRPDLLAVPGSTSRTRHRKDDKSLPLESRSMQDVRMAGNTNTNNLSVDGKLLRSSCLSLNGERRKRGKSPHRVSFKVS